MENEPRETWRRKKGANPMTVCRKSTKGHDWQVAPPRNGVERFMADWTTSFDGTVQYMYEILACTNCAMRWQRRHTRANEQLHAAKS